MGKSMGTASLTICTYIERERREVIKGISGENGGKWMEERKPFSANPHNTAGLRVETVAPFFNARLDPASLLSFVKIHNFYIYYMGLFGRVSGVAFC